MKRLALSVVLMVALSGIGICGEIENPGLTAPSTSDLVLILMNFMF
jgi:hypothetical protein